MPAAYHIVLTEEEDRTLAELRAASNVPQRTRERAHMLRLNAQGWTVPAIAEIFECHEHSVRATWRRWQADGLGELWEAPGRGAKPRWTEADLQAVEQWLAEEHSYTTQQLSERLMTERQVQLGVRRLQRLLQKRGGDGSDCVPVLPDRKQRNMTTPSEPKS